MYNIYWSKNLCINIFVSKGNISEVKIDPWIITNLWAQDIIRYVSIMPFGTIPWSWWEWLKNNTSCKKEKNVKVRGSRGNVQLYNWI